MHGLCYLLRVVDSIGRLVAIGTVGLVASEHVGHGEGGATSGV